MKTSSFALLAVAAAATAAVYATDPCNMGAIQGSLLENGTTWHDSCTASTGVDVFLLNSFPSKAEAKNISQSRDCVNYINQINQEANMDIQCETQVGDQTIVFAELLTDLLKGHSSNRTKAVVAAGSVSLSTSDSGSSASESASASASAATSESASGSEEESASASAEEQESSKSATAGSSAGVTVTATFSVVAAAATTVLAFAL